MTGVTQSISVETNATQTLVEQAHMALRANRIDMAAALLGEAVAREPDNPMVLTKLAEIAMHRKDYALARQHLTAALRHEPQFAPAWTELAAALWHSGRRGAAVAAARQAVEIQPYNPHYRLRLSQFAGWTGHIREATEAVAPILNAGITDHEQQAAAIGMLGEIAVAAGRFQDAMPLLQDALRRMPSLPAARVVLAMNQLRLGAFETGWVNLGIRQPGAELYPKGPPASFGPWWEGQDIAGKRILVADDQGHGDAIQFFRYLPMLRTRRPAHITWRTFPPLVRIFAAAAPDITVLAGLPNDSRFDTHCTSTSLPRWFGTTATTIPAPVPYLAPPSADQARLRPPSSERPKVGLVWSGDLRHMRDHLRSIPADLFLRLADTPGIQFYSLQHQVRETDRPALEQRPFINRELERAFDFADAATIVAGLDLIITVDTAIAHLAGALGKPVWILLHVAPDWRWQADRADSCWYPTARLFRLAPQEWVDRDRRATRRRAPAPEQEAADDMGWQPLILRVGRALRDRQRRHWL